MQAHVRDEAVRITAELPNVVEFKRAAKMSAVAE